MLWVSSSSRSAVEQQFFIDNFGAFFRVNTMYVVPLRPQDNYTDIFQKPYIELLYHTQVSPTHAYLAILYITRNLIDV